MDFSLQSFKDAFRDSRYSIKHKKFLVYSFILATPADRNVFPDLLTHFGELHHLTGEHILVISPKIGGYKAPNTPMNAAEIARVLSSKQFYDFRNNIYRDVSVAVERFLEEQVTQTYEFAKFIGLHVNEIPCIVFFDSLESPESYIRWSVEGTSATDVVKDFRKIVTVIESDDGKSNPLSAISVLDRRRFAVKVLKGVGKAVPVITSFIPG